MAPPAAAETSEQSPLWLGSSLRALQFMGSGLQLWAPSNGVWRVYRGLNVAFAGTQPLFFTTEPAKP